MFCTMVINDCTYMQEFIMLKRYLFRGEMSLGIIFAVQSTCDISKSKFIPNYWYLKVNFLIPENLLWDISNLKENELKYF